MKYILNNIFSKGFTLIELMIVVAIIGILSAIAIPKFAEIIRKADEGATKGKLGTLRSVLSIYYSENEGWFPRGQSSYSPNITYLQSCLSPRYIKEWPICYVPVYHVKTDTVDNYSTFSESEDSSCDGEWAYIGNNQDANWGTIFVECWHTDTKLNKPSTW